MNKTISIIILVAFIATSVKSPAFAQMSQDPMPRMPAPGVMVHLSSEFTPAYLKGIVIHPQNALKFDFIIYKGDKELTDAQKREEYTKLAKYFLASLAIPDDDQWVNLSPYEKDRIIKDDFGKTEMGRDLLAQDYMLKQITASLIYPQDNLGKKFWDRVYAQAQQQFGTTNIPVNTFNKVWILPDDALIYEKGNTAYVLKNHLKVMLEEDYLSLRKHPGITSAVIPKNTVIPSAAKDLNKINSIRDSSAMSQNDVNLLGSKIVRAIILPELEREVNEGRNFTAVRQVYSGMLLAAWYKRALKESLLSKIYANKARVKGVEYTSTVIPAPPALTGRKPEGQAGIRPKDDIERIYHQYLEAYKKGVFNFIKEDVDKYTNETIPRKYFSGGAVNNYPALLSRGGITSKLTPDQNEAMAAEINNRDDLAMFTAEEPQAADAAMTVKEFLPDIQAGLREVLEGFRELNPTENNLKPLLMSSPKTFQNWFLLAHKGQNLYHTIEHSLRVAIFAYRLTLNRWAPINRELYPDKRKLALKRAVFMFQVGLLDDFYPNRAANTPAKVPETLKFLELDWNQIKSLSGQKGESVLRDDLGWEEKEYWEARLMIYLTDFPAPEKHLKNVESILGEIYKLDDTGKELIFVLEAAYMLQEYADKANGYMVLDFNGTLQLIKDLAEEMKNSGMPSSPSAEVLTKNTYDDFLSKIGTQNENNPWFKVFQQLQDRLKNEKRFPGVGTKLKALEFPDLNKVSQWIPPKNMQLFEANKAGLKAYRDAINDGLTIKAAQKKGREAVVNYRMKADVHAVAPTEAMAVSPSKAMVAVPLGGIDFNSANLNLQIKRDGNGVPLPISQQNLENIHIDGLIPVIIEIKPAMASPLLSELQLSGTQKQAKI